MKYVVIILAVFLAVAFFSSPVYASNEEEIIYGSKIDAKIEFYKKQVHLVDSDYEILSEIGYSAIKKIVYLRENRYMLIDEMNANPKVGLSMAKINNFIGSRLGKLDNGIIIEAYSKEN